MKRKITQLSGIALIVLAIFIPNVLPTFASQSSAILDPLTIPKYENQLTGPPSVYESTNITDSTGKVIRHEYTITMSSFKEQILPPSTGLLTNVWGYGGMAKDASTGASLGYVQSSPGSSFEVVRGIPTQVKWVNNITSPYMFPVDPTIHWANPNNFSMPIPPFPSYPPGYPEAQSTAPLVTHLHGSETLSDYDGTPEQWFTADGKHGSTYSTYENTDLNAAVYYYPNTQPATTLWYHDHTLGLTRINVMSGLAGFYLLRDTNSSSDYVAPLLPTGNYEVPLLIQDRTFYKNGSLYFTTNGTNPDVNPYWADSFLGNTILVNGKVWPNMNVNQGQYRFRLLDGSNSRFYRFSFINTQTNTSIPFTQIGSDGGYLKSPVSLTNITMGPAERADILIDFSNLPAGSKILLKNAALTGGPSEDQTVGQIMQFTVMPKDGVKPNTLPTQLNPTLAGLVFPNLPNPTTNRILTLFRNNGPNGPLMMLLNGQSWDGTVSELPVIGTTEDWKFVDLTSGVHPMHIHLVQFQIVSRQAINATSYAADWINLQRKALGNQTATPPWPANFTPKELPIESYLIGTPTPPPPNEQGWKDTFLSLPFEVTIIRIRFASQDGSPFPFDATQGPGYVWHCHILDHEDNEMMRPFKVISASPQSQNTTTATTYAILLIAVVVAVVLLLYFQNKRRKLPKKENKNVT
jgi:spore coat protein A, manganese oxidase